MPSIDRSVKIGVASSIVASIIFIYLLDPLFSLLWRIIHHSAGSARQALIDKLFEQAALGEARDPAFVVMLFMITIIIFVPLGAIATSALQGLRARDSKGSEEKGHSRLWEALFIVSAILFLITGIEIMWSHWFQLTVTTSFCQHMKAVSPYISEQEEEALESEWTQMRTEQDYRHLYLKLSRIASTNKVRLPENIAYSLYSI
jgi:hypothetical protein